MEAAVEFVKTIFGFPRFGGLAMEAEEEAIGVAVVVKAFCDGVEEEVNALAVVAIKRGVVEVVGAFGGGEIGVREFARDAL